jgi:hypothetical protein
MAGFDAERYLRLTGPQRYPAFAAAAAALVAVGAITTADAQALTGDHDPASSPRQDHREPVSSQLRVVPCERVFDQPGARMTLYYAAFTAHATTLRADLRLTGPSQRLSRDPNPVPASARRLSVTDSRGATAVAEFYGGGRIGDPLVRGHYEISPRLATDVEWIELLGQRVELTAQPAGIQTWTEPLPAQDPAVRHVWERVATLNDFHDPHLALNATFAALAAAGALLADSPLIDEAHGVLAVLRPDGARPVPSPRDPPGPWRSLLARWGQTGGPVRTIAVGTITPAFDGITAAVTGLESLDEHFGISVELVPGARTGLPWHDLPDQQHLTWWAADDLGNYYLGEQGSWNPGENRSCGDIGFWPALDQRVTSIDLIPTATATRAVIRVPCAR